VEVARGFLDAYGAFDADRALTFLTEGALAEGGAYSAWGDADAFRLELAFQQAKGFDQILTDCEEQGDSANGTTVRCTYDFHDFYSDEIGRGPYGDNSWDIVVRDGKITSAVVNDTSITNGFSNEMWTPFQTWMASTHPEDMPVLYMGGGWAVTEESIPLWEQRLQEWVQSVKATAE
jgi:hypothetical protein